MKADRYGMETMWLKFKAIAAVTYAALLELLDADTSLIVLVGLLVLIDFVTGVRAAFIRGEGITARRLRDTAGKILEYTMVLVAFTAISTGFSLFGWMREAAFAYVCLTELRSIVENVFPKRGFWEGINKMKRVLDPTTDTHDKRGTHNEH